MALIETARHVNSFWGYCQFKQLSIHSVGVLAVFIDMKTSAIGMLEPVFGHGLATFCAAGTYSSLDLAVPDVSYHVFR